MSTVLPPAFREFAANAIGALNMINSATVRFLPVDPDGLDEFCELLETAIEKAETWANPVDAQQRPVIHSVPSAEG